MSNCIENFKLILNKSTTLSKKEIQAFRRVCLKDISHYLNNGNNKQKIDLAKLMFEFASSDQESKNTLTAILDEKNVQAILSTFSLNEILSKRHIDIVQKLATTISSIIDRLDDLYLLANEAYDDLANREDSIIADFGSQFKQYLQLLNSLKLENDDKLDFPEIDTKDFKKYVDNALKQFTNFAIEDLDETIKLVCNNHSLYDMVPECNELNFDIYIARNDVSHIIECLGKISDSLEDNCSMPAQYS